MGSTIHELLYIVDISKNSNNIFNLSYDACNTIINKTLNYLNTIDDEFYNIYFIYYQITIKTNFSSDNLDELLLSVIEADRLQYLMNICIYAIIYKNGSVIEMIIGNNIYKSNTDKDLLFIYYIKLLLKTFKNNKFNIFDKLLVNIFDELLVKIGKFDITLSDILTNKDIINNELYKYILSKIDIKSKSESLKILLYHIAYYGYIDILNLLFQDRQINIDVNMDLNDRGIFILYIASKYNKVNIVKEILSYPTINVNKLYDSLSSLYIACKKNNVEIVKLLLSHKNIDINHIYESINYNIIQIACIKYTDDIIRMLITHYKETYTTSSLNMWSLYDIFNNHKKSNILNINLIESYNELINMINNIKDDDLKTVYKNNIINNIINPLFNINTNSLDSNPIQFMG